MEKIFQRLSAAMLAAVCLLCAPLKVGAADHPQDAVACLAQHTIEIFSQSALAGSTARSDEPGLSYNVSWNEVCDIYPEGQSVRMDVAIIVAQNVTWQQFVGEMYEMGWVCHPYDGNGTSLKVESLAASTPATNQHLFCRERGTLRNVLLDDIIVRGDVLGTGKLGPSQLVRLMRAVTGAEPLTGVYAVAGDTNDNGQIDLGDLVILAAWLTGDNVVPPNVTYTIRQGQQA